MTRRSYRCVLSGQKCPPAAVLLLVVVSLAWGQKPPPAPLFQVRLVKLVSQTPAEAETTFRGDGFEKVAAVQFRTQKPGAEPLPVKIVKFEKNAPPAIRPSARGGAGQLQLETKAIPPGEIGVLQFLEILDKEKKPLGEIPWPLLEAASQSEKEPNNGFLEGNPIRDGQWFHGRISPAKDVDVFVWELPQGKSSVEIQAGRSQKQSLFDPFLMIHNQNGDLVKELVLSSSENRTISLRSPGKYFFSLLDLNDTESEFHHYQFKLTAR